MMTITTGAWLICMNIDSRVRASPVAACSTQLLHASPARSSMFGTITPTVAVAAMAARPAPASSSGPASCQRHPQSSGDDPRDGDGSRDGQ